MESRPRDIGAEIAAVIAALADRDCRSPSLLTARRVCRSRIEVTVTCRPAGGTRVEIVDFVDRRPGRRSYVEMAIASPPLQIQSRRSIILAFLAHIIGFDWEWIDSGVCLEEGEMKKKRTAVCITDWSGAVDIEREEH
jgi:hypothetical protein